MSRREHFDEGAGIRIVNSWDNTLPPAEGRAVAYSRGKRKLGALNYHVNEGFFPERTLYPDDLEVDPRHRGRGIATALHSAVLDDHPDLPMTHKVDAMSEDAVRALPRFQAARPGRHKVYDDDQRRYL